MSICTHRTALLGSCACLLLIGLSDLAGAQTAPTKLPEVVVSGVKPKPKPRARTCCGTCTGGARNPGGAAQRQGRRLRSKPQQSLHDHRHNVRHHHPVDHPGASRRRQPAGGENPVAGPGGVAGLRRKRAPSRPQRSCQCAIPYQRDHAARRPDRLRQHSRRQLDRQHGAWSWARSRPNTACAPSASSTSRPAPTFSTTAVKSALMAAVKERSPRRSNTAARSAAPVRR